MKYYAFQSLLPIGSSSQEEHIARMKREFPIQGRIGISVKINDESIYGPSYLTNAVYGFDSDDDFHAFRTSEAVSKLSVIQVLPLTEAEVQKYRVSN